MVLAGGAGRRMGGPKAWLDFHGTTLLEAAVSALAPGAEEVLVAAPPGVSLPATPGRRVYDPGPGLGPLGGIAAGLARMRSDVAVVVAVDMPRVDVALVQRLAAALGQAQVAVPFVQGRLHGTCAAYASTALPVVNALIDGGERRVSSLLERLDAVRVEGIDAEKLLNLNYPAQLEEASR